jgi:hypothetical protein
MDDPGGRALLVATSRCGTTIRSRTPLLLARAFGVGGFVNATVGWQPRRKCVPSALGCRPVLGASSATRHFAQARL